MKYTTVLAPAFALLLSGCVVGPNYKSPEAKLPVKFSESKEKAAEKVTLNPWWEAFRDKRLNTLIDQGRQENLSVQAAL